MKPRMDYFRASPKGMQAMRALQAHVKGCGFERSYVPDEVYAAAQEHFSEEELANLTLAMVAINGWNRLAIAFRAPAGTYRVGMFD